MPDTIVATRAAVYDGLRNTAAPADDQGIVLHFACPDVPFEKLRLATAQFVTGTLNAYFADRVFPVSPDWIDRYAEDIARLPNVTPGGAFMPKQETQGWYNQLLAAAVGLIRAAGVADGLHSADICSLRIVDGCNDPVRAKRPYATTKLHSDAWVGHHGDAVISIPLEGDVENTTVEFFEPEGVRPGFFEPLQDYDEGATRYDSLRALGRLRPRTFSIFDNLCLHRTVRGGGRRASLDLGVSLAGEGRRNIEASQIRYLPNEVWTRLGRETLWWTADSLFTDPASLNESARPRRLKRIIDLRDLRGE